MPEILESRSRTFYLRLRNHASIKFYLIKSRIVLNRQFFLITAPFQYKFFPCLKYVLSESKTATDFPAPQLPTPMNIPDVAVPF